MSDLTLEEERALYKLKRSRNRAALNREEYGFLEHEREKLRKLFFSSSSAEKSVQDIPDFVAAVLEKRVLDAVDDGDKKNDFETEDDIESDDEKTSFALTRLFNQVYSISSFQR